MTVETFFANFGHLANAPNGVQKLRELILQLAVQGKLVPQDLNDESAPCLIEKLKLKPVTQDTAYDVPSNWVWLSFSDAFDIKGGSQPPKSQFIDAPKKGYVRLLQIRDFGSKPVPVFVPEDSVSKLCAADDIMMGRYGASVGKVFTGQAGAYNVALVKFIFSRDLFDNLFVFNLLKSSYFQNHLADFSRSAQAGFNKGDLAKINIPLPPLEEQKRIVAKVDQLMALCDELEARQQKQQQGRVRLNNAALDALLTAREPIEFADHWQRISSNFDLLYDHPETIAKLRAAILQLAVQGKLVPQDPNDEPASVLLERIKAEKDRLVKEGKVKKQKPLPVITTDEDESTLPPGWKLVRVGDLGETQTGTTPPRCNKENVGDFIPFIGPGDIRNYNIDYSGQGLSEKGLANGRLIQEGSVMMVCIGGSIGKHAINDRDVSCNQQINTITPYSRDSVRYLFMAMGTERFQEMVIGASSGSATPIINKQKWSSIPIPVAPEAEQRRIVAKVDQLMALCDELETKLNQAQQHSEKLMEATVRKLLVA